MQISKFSLDDSFFYLLCRMEDNTNTLFVVTRDGDLHQSYEKIASFDIDDSGGLYIAHQNQTAISKYNVATNKRVYSMQVQSDYGDYRSKHICFESDSQLIYLATDVSVQVYDAKDGTFLKTVMLLSDAVVECPNNTFSMGVDNEKNVYFTSLSNNNSLQLYKYSYVEDLRKNMEPTLTITAPYRDDFLAKAILIYERDNIDSKIIYDYTYNNRADFMDNSSNDNYFAKANIELMAGDVGDIVVTGAWSDIYNQFNTDIFMDISKKLKSHPSFSELDPVILNAVKTGEEINGLPVAADYFYVMVNVKLCEKIGLKLDFANATWSEVLELVKQMENSENYLFSNYSAERTFVRMLISNMPDLIDIKNKTVNLRQSWFLELIEQWNTASKSPNFLLPNDTGELLENVLITTDGKTEFTYDADLAYSYAQYNATEGRCMRIVPLFSGEKNTNRTAMATNMYSITVALRDSCKIFSHKLQKEMAFKSGFLPS